MSSRRKRDINLPAPYLRRLWLDPSRVPDPEAYPFCLPFLRDEFSLSFDRAVTIIVGENGTGKSTLLEGIAVLAGYNEAGGGKGYMTVDHSMATEVMGGKLSAALRELVTEDHERMVFSRREFFLGCPLFGRSRTRSRTTGAGLPLAFAWRRLSAVLRGALPAARHLYFDEPESALSPSRQMEFLKLLQMMDRSGHCQVIMATHSPVLMAYPNATLLRLSKYGLEPTTVEQTDHFKALREFFDDPKGFIEAAIGD